MSRAVAAVAAKCVLAREGKRGRSAPGHDALRAAKGVREALHAEEAKRVRAAVDEAERACKRACLRLEEEQAALWRSPHVAEEWAASWRAMREGAGTL